MKNLSFKNPSSTFKRSQNYLQNNVPETSSYEDNSGQQVDQYQQVNFARFPNNYQRDTKRAKSKYYVKSGRDINKFNQSQMLNGRSNR